VNDVIPGKVRSELIRGAVIASAPEEAMGGEMKPGKGWSSELEFESGKDDLAKRFRDSKVDINNLRQWNGWNPNRHD
jgi:hypothetical protein